MKYFCVETENETLTLNVRLKKLKELFFKKMFMILLTFCIVVYNYSPFFEKLTNNNMSLKNSASDILFFLL